MKEHLSTLALTTTGTKAYANPPSQAANVIRLGDVIISADGATTVTVTAGGWSQAFYFAGPDTIVIPRGHCGSGGPGLVSSTGGSVNVTATVPWSYDIPYLHP